MKFVNGFISQCFSKIQHNFPKQIDVRIINYALDFVMICQCRFMNPIIFGDYPDIMKKNAGSRLPSFTQKESNLVKGSIDFLGINFYYSLYVKDSPDYLKKENRDYLADLSAKLQSMSRAVSLTYFYCIITNSIHRINRLLVYKCVFIVRGTILQFKNQYTSYEWNWTFS